LTSGSAVTHGYTKDLSENGLCVQVSRPFYPSSKHLTLHLDGGGGVQVAVQGLMTRQERIGTSFEVGVNLLHLGEAGTKAIIQEMFSRPESWSDAGVNGSGIWRSLWTVVTAFTAARPSRRPARRQFPRASRNLACHVEFLGRSYAAETKDISFLGLAAAIDEFPHVAGQGILSFPGIRLKITLVGVVRYGRQAIAQFRVDGIDKGDEQWHALNSSGW
jgi:hypothetical protein